MFPFGQVLFKITKFHSKSFISYLFHKYSELYKEKKPIVFRKFHSNRTLLINI